MEAECFEDEGIAKCLNDWFISIKLDRDERPDIDTVYGTYLESFYGRGSWPKSVFLSPVDLKPFMGSPYTPPDDNTSSSVRGFKTLIAEVRGNFDKNRDILLKNAGALPGALPASASPDELQDALHLCAKKLSETYDPKYGGFNLPTKSRFARPVGGIQLMLYWSKKLEKAGDFQEAAKALEMVLYSLQCMAYGSIHDHVGGGFHSCSKDQFWLVPSFSKVLLDQGQLANLYLDAFSTTKNSLYSCVSREILDYLKRDMCGLEGEFFSVEGDDSEFEGFYLWTSKELDDILEDDATLFKDHYGIKPLGNIENPTHTFEGKNALIVRKNTAVMASSIGMPVEQYLNILGKCREKLYFVRSVRPGWRRDDKIIVSWNGLTISSFARASKILKGEAEGEILIKNFPVHGHNANEYMEFAEDTSSFIKSKLYNEQTHRLKHSIRILPSEVPGFLDDYAFLISGLLDIYEFGGKVKWLIWAIELQDTQDELFLDREGGGYFTTTEEHTSVLFRVKDYCDGATPSGNSVSAVNLIRLASLLSGSRSGRYRKNAKKLLAFFVTELGKKAQDLPSMCCAADMLTVIISQNRKKVVVIGHKCNTFAEQFENMLVAAHSSYEPNKTVIHIDPRNKEDKEFWEGNNSELALMAENSLLEDKIVAYVFQNFTCCSGPLTDPAELLNTLLPKKASSSSA